MNFNVNDIRPEELMKLKEPLLEDDKKYLRDRIVEFIEVCCPACEYTHAYKWAEKEGFCYKKCPNCNTIFMSPRADEALSGEFYKQSKNYAFWNDYIFPATDLVRKNKIFYPRAIKTIDYCKKYLVNPKTLLEIGSAYGTFCEAIIELGYFENVVAVEPTPGLAETCRRKGITTKEQTVETLDFPKGTADVIANFEVIEHLSNPSNFISLISSFLKPGGLFICTCPNGLGIGTLLLREAASVVDHEHVNYFNPKSISILLQNNGFEILEITTPGELDVDLLKTYFLNNKDSNINNDFFKYLFEDSNKVSLQKFQDFLKDSFLSSHMWVIARKTE